MATEHCVLEIESGAKFEDVSSSVGKAWKTCLDMIVPSPGYQQLQWGYEIENPNKVDLLVNWESIGAHKSFMASPAYGPFCNEFGVCMGGGLDLHHVNYKPHPPKPLEAPVTELCTFYLDAKIAAGDKAEFEAAMNSFVESITKNAEGCKGAAWGYFIENASHGNIRHAKGCTLLVGWDSVDAHMAYRNTKVFEETITPIRKHVKGAEVHHVKFTQYAK